MEHAAEASEARLKAVPPRPSAAAPKPQEICPVLGGRIDRKVFADYQGKRIYFCCAGCPEEFRKAPEKYLKALRDQGVEPEAVPTTAPAGGHH